MLYPECERIANKVPDFRDTLTQLELIFSNIGKSGFLNPEDIALITSENKQRITDIFELLINEGFLKKELFIMCENPDCNELNEISDYNYAIENEEEYECSQCQNKINDNAARVIRYFIISPNVHPIKNIQEGDENMSNETNNKMRDVNINITGGTGHIIGTNLNHSTLSVNQTFLFKQEDKDMLIKHIEQIKSDVDKLDTHDSSKSLLKDNCDKIVQQISCSKPDKGIIKNYVDTIAVISQGISNSKDVITGIIGIATILQQYGIDISTVTKLFGM